PEAGPSLWFAYYHANRRSIALDLDSEADRGVLRDLIAGADVVLEDFRPGYLADRGLDDEALAAINPGLILASVTGFGQTGPHAGWRWTDLVAWSMGGMSYISGEPDREPLASAGQAGHFGSFYAAIGILIALAERAESGRGQRVDVSAQEAVAAHQETLVLPYTYNGESPRRMGSEYTLAVPYKVLPCRDGYVLVALLSQGQWASVTEWMAADGMAEDLTKEKWKDPLVRLANREHVHGVFARWVATYTKDVFFHESQARSVPCSRLSTPGDLAKDEHLAARDSLPERDWTGTGRSVRAPGPILRPSEEGWRFRRPAPRLDEHAAAIRAHGWAEPGASAECRGPSPGMGQGVPPATAAPDGAARPHRAARSMSGVEREARTPDPGTRNTGLPLAGVRVADFTWVGAGPMGTRVLADFGATVVKIEAVVGGDVLRGLGPYKDKVRTDNSSGIFSVFNRNKLSLRLDLKHPEGLAVAKRLIAWADVVPANFSAGTMDRFGLGYEVVRALNPRAVMVEMPGWGTFGPYRDYVSYAPTLQAASGVTYLTGYPDAAPTGIGNAYSDHVGGMTMALACLLGLTHRRRTGRGQPIEIAQIESSIAQIAPAVLDCLANGHVWEALGNRPVELPHGPAGVFRCAGDDRWVAIDIESDADWHAFCRAIARPDLLDHPDYATPGSRCSHAAALTAEVEAWTAHREPWEAARQLQAAGLAAGPVCDAVDLVERDPHLRDRGFWTTVDHPEMGPVLVDGSPIRLSRTPGGIRAPAPLLGQHTEQVLREFLSLTQEEVDALLIEGVVS
ncbi:MAG TPA: CoA transferase, partial [Dehalococcoidia bacterium]|nr:CoA transferase [Dehalococcoidia bacterium]